MRPANATISTSGGLSQLEAYLAVGDFAGACAVAAWRRRTAEDHDDAWIAYTAFHVRDYTGALALYESMDEDDVNTRSSFRAARAACLFRLRRFEEAESVARSAPPSPLRTRLLFHLAQQDDRCDTHCDREADVLEHHAQLTDTPADQATLGAAHFARGHYAEAVDVYSRLL